MNPDLMEFGLRRWPVTWNWSEGYRLDSSNAGLQ